MQTMSVAAVAAPTFTDYVAHAGGWRTIAGVPPEIAARLPGFADLGIDGDLLVEAVREAGPERGPATPGWPEAMTRRGDAAMAHAEAAERACDGALAERGFLDAAFWYFFARFPHVLNAGGATAYRRHHEAYWRAAAYFRHPAEVVRVPVVGCDFPAILRLPTGVAGPVPAVLLSGGMDVWKSDLELHHRAESLLRQGLATLAIDMPGTGECPIPVSTVADRVYAAALDHLGADARIDATRLGVYGLSFGGHFAAKLALTHPFLAGIVQIGGPIHHTFQPAHAGALPAGIRMGLARIMGLGPSGDPGRLAAGLAALSLSGQGLLPAATHAPLLSINGDGDELVPIADLHYLGEQGVRHDTLIFAGDRHTASRNFALNEDFAARWLAQRLAVG